MLRASKQVLVWRRLERRSTSTVLARLFATSDEFKRTALFSPTTGFLLSQAAVLVFLQEHLCMYVQFIPDQVPSDFSALEHVLRAGVFSISIHIGIRML